jgi:hypothetical protein
VIIDAIKGDRCELFDANGLPIHLAFRADTETGEVEEFIPGEDGHLYFDHATGDAAKRTVRYAAPLLAKNIWRWEDSP